MTSPTSPAPRPTTLGRAARTRIGRAVRSVVTALLLALALGVAGAGHAAAGTVERPDVTWGVRTASGDRGADRQNYAYTVAPGERVADAIVVTNHDDRPLELDLYAADGFTTDAGQLDVLPRASASTGVGAWVELATDRVTLDPGASLEVDFAVTVPADAEPGDHAGAVVTSLTVPEGEAGVSVDRRLGIRLHLRVSGDLRPVLAVEDLRLSHTGGANPFAPGAATVTYTVRNTGNARLSAGQDVTVSGPFGLGRVQAADLAAVPEILPGETWTVRAPVDGVWPLLRLTATAALTPTLPTGAADAPAVPAVRASAGTWAVPWALLVVLVGIAGGVVLARRLRARRRHAEDARVQEAVARALQDRDAAPPAGTAAAAPPAAVGAAPAPAPGTDADA